MTYSTSAPPILIAGGMNGTPRLWMYTEASAAAAAVDALGYFSNAYALGMRQGDLVFHYNQATKIWSAHSVVTCTAAAGADLSNGTTIGDGSSNSD